jgi:hypothetical protein
MRQAAGGLGDDVGTPRVGLGFIGVQVGNTPHRKPSQVRHQHAVGSRHRNRASRESALIPACRNRAVTRNARCPLALGAVHLKAGGIPRQSVLVTPEEVSASAPRSVVLGADDPSSSRGRIPWAASPSTAARWCRSLRSRIVAWRARATSWQAHLHDTKATMCIPATLPPNPLVALQRRENEYWYCVEDRIGVTSRARVSRREITGMT